MPGSWRAALDARIPGAVTSRTSLAHPAGAREESSGPATTAEPFGHPAEEFVLLVRPLELSLVLVESDQQVAG